MGSPSRICLFVYLFCSAARGVDAASRWWFVVVTFGVDFASARLKTTSCCLLQLLPCIVLKTSQNVRGVVLEVSDDNIQQQVLNIAFVCLAFLKII